MITYLQAKSYLNSLIDYEKKVSFAYAEVIKLGRMHQLLKLASIPYRQLRFIHVAGTKGKGSTAHVCAHALAALGFRVGLYTSPHFFDFRERIVIIDGSHPQLDSRMIPKTAVVRLVMQMRPAIERLRHVHKFGDLSFFEVYTALAFKYFCQAKPDYVVLETGLGGRLDATNVVVPLASIITRIGFDHMDKLGYRLAQIAGEKAGIIKPGVPVITPRQAPSAQRVIKDRCKKLSAPLFVLGKDFNTSRLSMKNTHTSFNFYSPSQKTPAYRQGMNAVENNCCEARSGAKAKQSCPPSPRLRRDRCEARAKQDFVGIPLPREPRPLGRVGLHSDKLSIPGIRSSLRGKYQAENIALALQAVKLVSPKGFSVPLVKKGVRLARLAGRFETLSTAPLTIVDIAHNPLAFSVLKESLGIYYPHKKIILIFGASQDKDIKKMLNNITYAHIILTKFDNPRTFQPRDIQKICGLRDPYIAASVKEAYAYAGKLYTPRSLILIAGSFFLVSEAKRLLQATSHKLQAQR